MGQTTTDNQEQAVEQTGASTTATTAVDAMRTEGNSAARPPENPTGTAVADAVPAQINTDGSINFGSNEQVRPSGDQPRAGNLTPDQVNNAVAQIHDAAHDSKINIGPVHAISDADEGRIFNIMEPMSAADRAQVAVAYVQQHDREWANQNALTGANQIDYIRRFTERLGPKLGRTDGAHLEALMYRQDGLPDYTGQIHTALAKLDEMGQVRVNASRAGVHGQAISDDRANAEKEIRDTLSLLSGDGIRSVQEKYTRDYPGRDFNKDLLESKNISQATKDALAIYLQGNDNRSDEDTLKLARIGLNAKPPRVEIFNEAFRNAPESARQSFKQQGGEQEIDRAFPADGDAKALARDYLEKGHVGLVTIARGNHHLWHTNENEISRSMLSATKEEREQFLRGRALAEKREQVQPGSQEEKDLQFFRGLDDALRNAGGNRKAMIWESQLAGTNSVITQVLQSHKDGWGPLNWGSSTDKQKLFSAIENMSQKDWDNFRSDPSELNRVDRALSTFANDRERNQAMQMLYDKLGLRARSDGSQYYDNDLTYVQSQNLGRRSLDQVFQDTKKSTDRLDALAHLTPQDQQAHLQQLAERGNDVSQTDFGKLIQQLPEGPDRVLAQRYLSRVGEDPNSVSPQEKLKRDSIDRVLMDSVRHDNPLQTINDIEKAFQADPTLRERLQSPTGDDVQLSKLFHQAFMRSAQEANMGFVRDDDVNLDLPERRPYQQWEKPLFENGRLDLFDKLFFTHDKKQRFEQIVYNSTPEERAKLLRTDLTGDDRAWQDRILGSGGERQLLLNGLSQGYYGADGTLQQGHLTEADKFKAYTLGGGPTTEQLSQRLASMTPEQRQDLANEYYFKYNKLITEEVIGKVPDGEKWRFRELLAPTDVPLQQVALDAQRESHRHTSAWDKFMTGQWDYSKVGKDEGSQALFKFIQENQAQINNLPPEQRTQFFTAVNNYQQAQRNYIASKGELADQFIDATITVAAIAGTIGSGGTMSPLLGALAGGSYRAIMSKSIQGTDHGDEPLQVYKDVVKGGVTGWASLLAPEALGLRVAANGAVSETALAAVRARVAQEAKMYTANLITAQVAGSAAEVVSTAAGLEDASTLWDRMQGSFVSTMGGVTFFHGLTRAVSAGHQATEVLLRRTPDGGYAAGPGTAYRDADGNVRTVTLNEGEHRLAPGERVITQETPAEYQARVAQIGDAPLKPQSTTPTDYYSRPAAERTSVLQNGRIDEGNMTPFVTDGAIKKGMYQTTVDGVPVLIRPATEGHALTVRNEFALQELSGEIGFDYPATARRTVTLPDGTQMDAIVQQRLDGRSVSDLFEPPKNALGDRNPYDPELVKTFVKNNEAAIMDSSVQEIVFGLYDAHTANKMIVPRPDGARVQNIDADFAFSTNDQATPYLFMDSNRNQRLQGFIYDQLRGKEIPAETVNKLRNFTDKYMDSSGAIKEEPMRDLMARSGLTRVEAEAMLKRAKTLSTGDPPVFPDYLKTEGNVGLDSGVSYFMENRQITAHYVERLNDPSQPNVAREFLEHYSDPNHPGRTLEIWVMAPVPPEVQSLMARYRGQSGPPFDEAEARQILSRALSERLDRVTPRPYPNPQN